MNHTPQIIINIFEHRYQNNLNGIPNVELHEGLGSMLLKTALTKAAAKKAVQSLALASTIVLDGGGAAGRAAALQGLEQATKVMAPSIERAAISMGADTIIPKVVTTTGKATLAAPKITVNAVKTGATTAEVAAKDAAKVVGLSKTAATTQTPKIVSARGFHAPTKTPAATPTAAPATSEVSNAVTAAPIADKAPVVAPAVTTNPVKAPDIAPIRAEVTNPIINPHPDPKPLIKSTPPLPPGPAMDKSIPKRIPANTDVSRLPAYNPWRQNGSGRLDVNIGLAGEAIGNYATRYRIA